MEPWLNAKMDQMVQEFTAGHGTPAVFSACFLTYLEVLVVYKYGGPGSLRLWGMVADLQKDGQAPADYMTKDELVVCMADLRKTFQGPTKRPLRAPSPKVSAQDKRAEAEPKAPEPLGIEALLLSIHDEEEDDELHI
jgi:hypothetical protein